MSAPHIPGPQAALSMCALSVGTFAPMLRNLTGLLNKAVLAVGEGALDGATLADARLAPDMYTLAQQVLLACQQAHNGVDRLIGVTPSGPELEGASLEAMLAQIAATVDYLEALSPQAFDGADGRFIVLPVADALELHMNGLQYLRDWALPHFYFHMVTAYDILRHEGLAIGKRDYLAHVAAHLVQRGS